MNRPRMRPVMLSILAAALALGSLPLSVAAARPNLVYVAQPGGAVADLPFTNQPVVRVEKSPGQVDPTATGTVTLTIHSGTGTPGALLACSANTVPLIGGVATFSGCSIDKAGTNYRLRAVWSGGDTADSARFDVTATATKLAFTAQPGGGPALVAWPAQPVVTVQTASGATVTSSSAVITLAIFPGTGTPGAILSCAGGLQRAAVNGVAAFGGCSIDRAGINYVLVATATGLASATSAAFSVSGIERGLGFTVQPARGTPGHPFVVQPVVTIQDAVGATVAGSTRTVTLALATNPGGAVLNCTGGLSKAAVNGLVTFVGCGLSAVGVGYRLLATSTTPAPALTSATSALFDVSDRLVFSTQPVGAGVGAVLPTQPVVAVSAGPAAVASHDQATVVTLSIKPGTGAPGALLVCSGGLSRTVVNGYAAFSGCAIDRASPTLPANPYQLIATATDLTAATSAAFTVGLTAVVSVTPSAHVITWGGTVVLAVQVGPTSVPRIVDLQATRDGTSWATIATLLSNTTGLATFAYRPATNLWYRAVFAGAVDLGGATSPTIRVVVRQISILRPTNLGTVRLVLRGRTVTFVTTVRPSRQDLLPAVVRYRVFRLVGRVWVLSETRDVVVNAVGQALTTWRFAVAGQWYIRSQARPTPYNANSAWGPVERYSVR